MGGAEAQESPALSSKRGLSPRPTAFQDSVTSIQVAASQSKKMQES